MRAITYANNGFAAGCNATVIGVSQLSAPGHPTTSFMLVPVGNNKCFDVYIYVKGDQERRVAEAIPLGVAITLALNFQLDTLESV